MLEGADVLADNLSWFIETNYLTNEKRKKTTVVCRSNYGLVITVYG